MKPGSHHSEESKKLIGEANTRRAFSAETREKKRQARLGKRDSEETRAKKRANLELARAKQQEMKRSQYTYTDCDFCGGLGPEEEKFTIRYEEEDANFGLCPRCFAEWQRKPDKAKVIKVGRQEQSA